MAAVGPQEVAPARGSGAMIGMAAWELKGRLIVAAVRNLRPTAARSSAQKASQCAGSGRRTARCFETTNKVSRETSEMLSAAAMLPRDNEIEAIISEAFRPLRWVVD